MHWVVAMITRENKPVVSTTYPPDPPHPEHKPEEPTRPQPDEMPSTEPKHYPIHPDIPVQPIHEKDPPTCGPIGSASGTFLPRAHATEVTP